MDLLAERRIPLEVCPTSNLRTGALALQLHNPAATLQQHPLPQLLRHGIPVVLSTDDPAMFHTSLLGEYEIAAQMGLGEAELVGLHRNAAAHSFLPDEARRALLATLPRK
jgi:aminodeoxyfutalosine deaminase